MSNKNNSPRLNIPKNNENNISPRLSVPKIQLNPPPKNDLNTAILKPETIELLKRAVSAKKEIPLFTRLIGYIWKLIKLIPFLLITFYIVIDIFFIQTPTNYNPELITQYKLTGLSICDPDFTKEGNILTTEQAEKILEKFVISIEHLDRKQIFDWISQFTEKNLYYLEIRDNFYANHIDGEILLNTFERKLEKEMCKFLNISVRGCGMIEYDLIMKLRAHQCFRLDGDLAEWIEKSTIPSVNFFEVYWYLKKVVKSLNMKSDSFSPLEVKPLDVTLYKNFGNQLIWDQDLYSDLKRKIKEPLDVLSFAKQFRFILKENTTDAASFIKSVKKKKYMILSENHEIAAASGEGFPDFSYFLEQEGFNGKSLFLFTDLDRNEYVRKELKGNMWYLRLIILEELELLYNFYYFDPNKISNLIN